MGELEEKNPDPIYIVPDILERIFLGLPLKSILRFKTVSKQWRSILESKMFVERRRDVQKSRKILASNNCRCGDRPSLLPESRFDGDEEIAFVHCDAARPSMACNGLVCLLEPDWIIVLNPSTGQILRFPLDIDTSSPRFGNLRGEEFLGDWVFGFGRDTVSGSYKVVKLCLGSMVEECDVLDVESGEWKKLRLPPCVISVGRKPVCVNGSVYWIFLRKTHIGSDNRILALDLHKEEFHDVSVPDTLVTRETQVVNIEERLVAAKPRRGGPECILEVWSMNAEEETWTKIYSISLAACLPEAKSSPLFLTPVAVSKQGDLVFYSDVDRRLLKYYSEKDEVRCLCLNMGVISAYLENLAPLRSESGHHHPDYKIRTSSCRLFPKDPVPVSRKIIEVVETSWMREIRLSRRR